MNENHHDNARAEKQRLVARINAGLKDLGDLDPVVRGLAIHVECELYGMGYEPPPEPSAGPSSPPIK